MEQRPIIIKKIKKHGHAHHGGSWKVAYADFVTAMMAFFLLMWLMGFTTEGERKAIADYFQNPSAIQGEGGSSTSLIDMSTGMDSPRTNEKKPNQDTASVNAKDTPSEAPGDTLAASEESKKLLTEADKKRLESLMDELKQAIDASQALKPFKDQLFIDITSEGLRIQIVDKENRPMFSVGSARLQSYTRDILREISKVVAAVPNRISIAGHTDALPYTAGADYGNWELSAERANACRRELVNGGVAGSKVARVVGLASTALFDKANPLSPINRRISIVVLNRETEEAMLKGEESEKQVESEVGVTADMLGTTEALAAPVVSTPEVAPELAKPVEPTPVHTPAPATAKAIEVTKPEPIFTQPVAPVEKPRDKPKAKKESDVKMEAVPAHTPDSIKLPTVAPVIQIPGMPTQTPVSGGPVVPPAKLRVSAPKVSEKAASTPPATTLEEAAESAAKPIEKPKAAVKKAPATKDAAPPLDVAPDAIKLPGIAPAIQLPGLPGINPSNSKP